MEASWIAGFSQEKLENYEMDMKTELDYDWERDGEHEGVDMGGRGHGHKRGREEGREEGRVETAKNFKCNGVPLELIAKCTGLSIETIEAL